MGGYVSASSIAGAALGRLLRGHKFDKTDAFLLVGGTSIVLLLLITVASTSLWGDNVEEKGKDFAIANSEVLSSTGAIRTVSVIGKSYRSYVSDTEVPYYSITYRVVGENGPYQVEVATAGHPRMPKFNIIQVKPGL